MPHAWLAGEQRRRGRGEWEGGVGGGRVGDTFSPSGSLSKVTYTHLTWLYCTRIMAPALSSPPHPHPPLPPPLLSFFNLYCSLVGHKGGFFYFYFWSYCCWSGKKKKKMIISPASKNSFGVHHLCAGAARLFAGAPRRQTARAHQLTRGLCVFTAQRRLERALYRAEALRPSSGFRVGYGGWLR